MVLVSGEATILGLSVVEVSGAAAIRDDISMTARRTTLAKTFQTKLFRRNGDSHAHAHARDQHHTLWPTTLVKIKVENFCVIEVVSVWRPLQCCWDQTPLQKNLLQL